MHFASLEAVDLAGSNPPPAATAPGAPTLTSATAGNGSVSLQWTPPADGGSQITNYNVYRSTQSGQEVFLTQLGNVTSYTNTGLTNGQIYWYKVLAVNAVGEGALSNELSATPQATATVPGAPTLTSATAGNGSVSLQWTPPADGGSQITNYNVYRSTQSGQEVFLTQLGNVTSYTNTGLTNGQIYWYKVLAVNAVGEGALSNELSATPQATATVPGAPTLTSATAGNGSVSLQWTPPSDGGSQITNYNVYRSTQSGQEVFLTQLGNVTSYTNTGLTNGQIYWYKVLAVNAVGEGALSNELSATPASAALPPDPPTNLTAQPASGRGVNLTWVAPSNDGGSPVTGYKIYRGGVLLTTVTTTSYKDAATTRQTTYSYWVTALTAAGESPPSNTASATAT